MSSGTKGTIYLFHNPTKNRLEVHAENNGASPGLLTHNVRKTKENALSTEYQHDDNIQFGHGDPVPGGTETKPGRAVQYFPIGATYNGYGGGGAGNNYKVTPVPVVPGSWFRTGFRGQSYAVAEIPQPGEIIEIHYEDMLPQPSAHWKPDKLVRAEGHYPPAIQAYFDDLEPCLVRGEARIVPATSPDDPSKLIGWNVWFENKAPGKPIKDQTHGFTATVTLIDEHGEGAKNGGLGLESMPCAHGNDSARQFIKLGGDYGAVIAEPGTQVRLGIRGHSHFDTTLPALDQGELKLKLDAFDRDDADHQSNWFEGDALVLKMGEKKGRVDFFRKGARINDQLPDTIYEGDEAFIRAEFKQPPRLVIDRVAHSAELPGGGWKVSLKNELPDSDNLGPVGFDGALKLEVGGKLVSDPAALPPVTFSPKDRTATLFIPLGHNLGGVELTEGTELTIDTGPLGWRGTVKLPKLGKQIDTSRDNKTLRSTWKLRETDYHRAKLYPLERGE